MNVDQLVFVRQDTNVTPEHRRHLRVELDRAGRAAGAGRVRRRAPERCSRWRRSSSACRRRALSVSGGVVSGGGRSVTYGGARRRPAARGAAAGADPRSRRRRRRSRSRPTALVGHLADAASRHPGEGDGDLHLHPQRPGARDAPRRGSCGRSARAPTATGRSPGSSRSTSARSPASATRGSCGAATSRASSPRGSTTRSRRRRG